MRAIIPACMLVCCALAASAEDLPSLDEALSQLPGYTLGQSRAVLSVVETASYDAEQAPEIERQLIVIFGQQQTSTGTKRFICRTLGRIGTAASVPVLAASLSDPELANAAVWALERIPGQEAGAALADSLAKAPVPLQLAMIAALGSRGEDAPLVPLLDNAERQVAVDAAYAIGRVGSARGCDAVLARLPVAEGLLHAALADAALACAQAGMARGDGEQAGNVFDILSASGEAGHVRAAALSGRIQLAPDTAVALVVEALADSEPELAKVAISYIREIPGVKATRIFAAQLPKVTPENRALLLDALGDRGDPEAAAAVLGALEDDDTDVRRVAVVALGKLGGADAVEPLVAAALGGRQADRRIVRASLATLPGPGVDDVLVRLTGRGGEDQRIVAIESLSARRAIEQRAAVLTIAKQSEGAVREAALGALEVLATEEDFPALLALLPGDDEGHRGQIEDAIVAVALRMPEVDRRADAAIGCLDAAAKPEELTALYRILGRIANGAAYAALKQGLTESAPSIRIAAVEALAAWPGETPLDDLMTIARAGAGAERGIALDGMVRMLRASDRLPPETLLAHYRETLALAQDVAVKQQIIAGLATVALPASIDAVHGLREAPELVASADVAVVQLARALCGAYPEVAQEAVAPYLEAGTDETLQASAQKVIDTMAAFEGYLTAWQVAGPFAEEGMSGSMLYDVALPPEQGDAGVIWCIMPMAVRPDRPAWVLDLDAVVGGYERTAFLRTTLEASSATRAVLELGTNDGCKVWLNGELIHGVNVGRSLTPGQDQVPLRLKAGENALLIAVYQHGGDWAACARLRNAAGGAVPEVKTYVR